MINGSWLNIHCILSLYREFILDSQVRKSISDGYFGYGAFWDITLRKKDNLFIIRGYVFEINISTILIFYRSAYYPILLTHLKTMVGVC